MAAAVRRMRRGEWPETFSGAAIPIPSGTLCTAIDRARRIPAGARCESRCRWPPSGALWAAIAKTMKTQPGKGGALSAAPIPPFEAVQEDHQQQGGGHAQHHVGPTPVADSGGKEAPQGDGQHDAHRHPQGKGEPPLGQGTEPQHNEGPEQGGHAGKGAVCDRFTHRQDLTAGI